MLPQIPKLINVVQGPGKSEVLTTLEQAVQGVPVGAVPTPSLEALAENGPPKLQKMARTQMTAWKQRHLRVVQNGLCPLCNLPLDLRIKGEGVIDHDHDTGRIRGVLHRSCNAAEGKISNAAARWGAKSSAYTDIIQYLKRVVVYLEKEPTTIIYPHHKTGEEKRLDRNKAVREKRAQAAAKKRLKEQS